MLALAGRFQPFGRLPDGPEWLKTYRAYSLLAGLLVSVLGIAYRLSTSDDFDPLWLRAALAALCFGLLAASFAWPAVARRLDRLVYALFIVLSAWFFVLTIENEFAADYAAGLVFVVAAVSLALSLAPNVGRSLVWYHVFMVVLVAFGLFITPESQTSRLVLIGCVVGIAIVTSVAAGVRIQLEQERELYRQKVDEASLRVEEMLRLKASIINNINHEIRTPLTGILGFSEIIAETADQEQREHARVIRDAGRRLMTTLTTILDLAHLEAGTYTLHVSAIDLRALAVDVVETLREAARKKNVELMVHPESAPAVALADAGAVARIVYNLVANGVKFTDEGIVTVRTHVGRGSAYLTVEDTGIGIDETFVAQVFDEFKQASSGFERSHEGCGLGLTVTKRLVELMDGEIEITSNRGRGSAFTVSLPLSRNGVLPHAQPVHAETLPTSHTSKV